MTMDQEGTKARPSASGVEKMSSLVSLTLSETTTPRPQDPDRAEAGRGHGPAKRFHRAAAQSVPWGIPKLGYHPVEFHRDSSRSVIRGSAVALISFIRHAIGLCFETMILLRQYLIRINWCQNRFLFQVDFLDIQNRSAARAPLYGPPFASVYATWVLEISAFIRSQTFLLVSLMCMMKPCFFAEKSKSYVGW